MAESHRVAGGDVLVLRVIEIFLCFSGELCKLLFNPCDGRRRPCGCGGTFLFFFFRQVGENGINDQGIVDAGYHFDGACAAFTHRDVNIEHPLMGSING